MRVGVGLPNAIPGTDPALLLHWAKAAEEAGFSSLGALDRVRYRCYEPLASLAAAAGVTELITLVTMIVISPLRNAVVLANQAATVDALSGGRLVLGVAVGARLEDYEAAGVDARVRGRVLDRQLETLRERWEDPETGPPTLRPLGPRLLVGGLSDAAFWRMARMADGYVHGGGPPRAFARAASSARTAWVDAGRPGTPQLWGQGYFALGEGAETAGRAYLRDYYSFTGPFADVIADGLLANAQDIAAFVRGYAEAGCDELVLLPATASPDQLERLSEVLPEAS